MKIYERIFMRLEELHMSQIQLSKMTGIPTSTISDWRKKQINPQSDKLVSICKALNMSLTDLLCEDNDREQQVDYSVGERCLVECYRRLDDIQKKNMIRYFELYISAQSSNRKDKRNVTIVRDTEGKDIVLINDTKFRRKRAIDWKEVRKYLKEFVGEAYEISSTGDMIYIGTDLPNEYSGSRYTHTLKGTNAKAKANASQGIPELIEIANGKQYKPNHEQKHWRNAKYGWYKYDSRFALPVYDENGEIARYNVFHASLIIRYSEDKKLYLYDILNIKKETGNPIES